MAIYPTGVSDNVVALCTSKETIASAVAKANTTSIHTICETLYPKPFVLKRLVNRFTIKHDLYHGRGDPTKEDLDRAEQCGKFPYRPSDLFLKVGEACRCLQQSSKHRVRELKGVVRAYLQLLVATLPPRARSPPLALHAHPHTRPDVLGRPSLPRARSLGGSVLPAIDWDFWRHAFNGSLGVSCDVQSPRSRKHVT